MLRLIPLVTWLLLLAVPSWGQVSVHFRTGRPGVAIVCDDPRVPVGFCRVDALPQACREPMQEVDEFIDRLVERHAYCRRDSDCAFLDTSTACHSTCGAYVNRRVDSRLARQIRHLDQRRCDAFRGGECQAFLHERCRPQRPVCVRNRCTAAPSGRPLTSPKAALRPRAEAPVVPFQPIVRGPLYVEPPAIGGTGAGFRTDDPGGFVLIIEDTSPP